MGKKMYQNERNFFNIAIPDMETYFVSSSNLIKIKIFERKYFILKRGSIVVGGGGGGGRRGQLGRKDL